MKKKCCIFSCGSNLNEHANNNLFEKIKNNSIDIVCIKQSINIISDKYCDLLFLGGQQNGEYYKHLNDIKCKKICVSQDEIFNENEKYCDVIIYKNRGKKFLSIDDEIIINKNNITSFNYHEIDDFILFLFLQKMGYNEFYLFGFYYNDIIPNIEKYDIDDLYMSSSHFYLNSYVLSLDHKPTKRICEPAFFYGNIQFSYFAEWALKHDVIVYNVSELGSITNKIPRIEQESIFCNEKKIICSKNKYTDFIDVFNKLIDIDFYIKKYLPDKSNLLPELKKELCINHYICDGAGIYLHNSLNYNHYNNINTNYFSTKLKRFLISLFIISKTYLLNYLIMNMHYINMFYCLGFAETIKHKFNLDIKDITILLESNNMDKYISDNYFRYKLLGQQYITKKKYDLPWIHLPNVTNKKIIDFIEENNKKEIYYAFLIYANLKIK
jgi:hypothetical protein